MRNIKLLALAILISVSTTIGTRLFSGVMENRSFSQLSSDTCVMLIPLIQVGSIKNTFEQAQSILRRYLPESQFGIEIVENGQTLFERPPGTSGWHAEECQAPGRQDASLKLFFKPSIPWNEHLIFWIFVNSLWLWAVLFFAQMIARITLSNIQSGSFTELSRSLGFSDDPTKNSKFAPFVKWILSSQSSQRGLRTQVEILKNRIATQEQRNLELARTQVQREEALKRTQDFVEVVGQIQHDIRGPLQTLSSVVDLPTVDAQDRQILLTTTQKIKSMVNNLTLQEQMMNTSLEGISDQVAEIQIEQVIREKRLAVKGHKAINFNFEYDAKELNLVAVDPFQFNRVISNLIQNAIESITDTGVIEITCRKRGRLLFILVKDTGQGISPEIQSQLFKKGATFGKSGGSGLGLSHARSCVERWKGEINLESTQGLGTTIIIQLPISETHAKIVSEFERDDKSVNVIVDDEIDVLSSLEAKVGDKVLYFDSPHDFQDWKKTSGAAEKIRGIFDFNLKSSLTGLNLISELAVPADGILVTNDYDRPEVLEASQAIGFRILPKFFLSI